MRIRSVLTHTGEALFEGFLIAVLVVGLMVGTTFAGGKGGGGGSHHGGNASSGMSITVDTVVDANGNELPNWADTIHFGFTTSNQYPTVSVSCTQNGGLVFGDSHPYYWPNMWDDNGNVILSSQAWASGAADCQVVVKGTSGSKTVTLGSKSFQVGA